MLDASLPDSGYKEKINFFFYFHISFTCGTSKGFMKPLKATQRGFTKERLGILKVKSQQSCFDICF